jgi:hypothetical protein
MVRHYRLQAMAFYRVQNCYNIVSKHKATIHVETGSSGTNFIIGFESNEVDHHSLRYA